MKIRCRSCYRVLNNDEEYCTRCGTHSDEVKELMDSGITPIDEVAVAKQSLIMYLLIAFLLNGILNVLFGVIFNTIHAGYNYGEVGMDLPLAVTYFSAANSLLITSVIIIFVAFMFNYKDLLPFIKINDKKQFLITTGVGILVMVGITFITKYTDLTFLPIYIRDFLMNPTIDMKLEGSFNLFKIIVVLLCYAFAEEVIFRKALINGFDEGTLLRDSSIIILQTLISTILTSACFLLLQKTSFVDYMWTIGGNLIFHLLMGLNYYFNKRSIASNLIIRLIFIILVVIIL